MDIAELGITIGKILVIFGAIMGVVAYITLVERKVLGHMQSRHGPLHVGWHGLLQPIADGIKLFFKEDITVSEANKVIYNLAPFIVVTSALLCFAVIPFGGIINIFGKELGLYIADVNVALLYILAVSSLSVYGVVLAGWSSNSKYPLLGGLRASAQMISYEIATGLSIIGILMISGSFSLVDIVNSQKGLWNIVTQPLGFIIFLICGFAECNRTPFDLPEAENELVAGFHTEYSSMKFALFFMGEYAHIIVISSLITTLFLGGWYGPVFSGVIWFIVKTSFFAFLFIWVRATFPRFRYDQLMKFGWKVLLPLGLFNIIITALFIAYIKGW
jgi:NADH-quinone oxidoreductase subunit H